MSDLLRQGVGLVRSLLADPNDEATRLVLSDWLSENRLPGEDEGEEKKAVRLLRQLEIPIRAWFYRSRMGNIQVGVASRSDVQRESYVWLGAWPLWVWDGAPKHYEVQEGETPPPVDPVYRMSMGELREEVFRLRKELTEARGGK